MNSIFLLNICVCAGYEQQSLLKDINAVVYYVYRMHDNSNPPMNSSTPFLDNQIRTREPSLPTIRSSVASVSAFAHGINVHIVTIPLATRPGFRVLPCFTPRHVQPDILYHFSL